MNLLTAVLFGQLLAPPQAPPLAAPSPSLARYEDALQALTPSDATVVVRFASVDRFIAAFDAVGVAVAGEARTPAIAVLAELLAVDPATLLPDRPVVMAVSVASGMPVPTFVLPVRDAATFEQGLAEPPQRHGDYVGFSPMGAYVAGGSTLLAGLPDRAVSARVDLSALLEQYRPLIDMGLEQFQEQLGSLPQDPAVPVDLSAMAEFYVDLAEGFLDSVDRLDVAFDVTGERLLSDLVLHTLDGSAMASLASTKKVAYGPALGDAAGGAMEFVVAADQAALWQHMVPLMDMLEGMVPEEMRAGQRESLAAWGELAPMLGPVTTASLDFDGGLCFSYVIDAGEHTDDALSAIDRMLTGMSASGAYELTSLPKLTVEGLEVTRMRLVVDAASFTAASGGGEAGEAVQKMVDAMYGDLVYSVVTHGGRILLRMGHEGAGEEAAVRRFAKPEAPRPELARELARLGDTMPAFVSYVDLARLVNGMGDLMGKAGALPQTLPRIKGAVPMLVSGLVTPVAWSQRLELDLTGLGRLVKALE